MKNRTKIAAGLACILILVAVCMILPRKPLKQHAQNVAPTGGQLPDAAHPMMVVGKMSEETVNLEKKKRAPVLDEWLQSVKVVIEKTQDKRAIELMNALAVGRLCMPTKDGFAFLESPAEDFWIAVIPILPEDIALNPRFAQNGETYAGATFSPETNVMILQAAKLTPKLRGVLFLHELDHADRFFTTRYDWKDPRTFCHEERKVHEDQNRWFSQLGGKPYDTVVNTEVERQKKFLAEKKMEIGVAFLEHEPSYPKLDAIFGKSLSKQETDFRSTQVWIHAQFRLIEGVADVPDEAKDERKALFLKTIYHTGGILEQLNK